VKVILKQDVIAILAKKAELCAYAQVLRSQDHTRHNDMMILAKNLAKQAQLDLQLATLGVNITPDEIQPMYEDAHQEEKRIVELKDLAANKLKAMLEDHETGMIGDRLVSWKSVKGERLDTKSLKVDQPMIYSQYAKESAYRRFAIK